MDVFAQATPLIAFLSGMEVRNHIPPTENMHCKITGAMALGNYVDVTN